MFRRMVTRMGLPVLAGLGLLLIGGPAMADTQGWPLQGRDTQSSFSQGRSDRTFSPDSARSFSPSYYSTYLSPVPPAASYYGSASTGYYYEASTAETSTKCVARINLRVPADAKIWLVEAVCKRGALVLGTFEKKEHRSGEY